MQAEVQYAGSCHRGCLLRHLPGNGCPRCDSNGRRAPWPSLQLDVERRTDAEEVELGVFWGEIRSCRVRLVQLHGFQCSRQAVFTETAVLNINPFHRMRRSHCALVVMTMGEAQGVSEFVYRLDQKPIGE
jgi:hypothetical protein